MSKNKNANITCDKWPDCYANDVSAGLSEPWTPKHLKVTPIRDLDGLETAKGLRSRRGIRPSSRQLFKNPPT